MELKDLRVGQTVLTGNSFSLNPSWHNKKLKVTKIERDKLWVTNLDRNHFYFDKEVRIPPSLIKCAVFCEPTDGILV